MFYWLYAHQIQQGTWAFHLFGVSRHYPCYLYPLFLAGVTWPFSSISVQYTVAQVLGALVISTAVFPTYALARDLGGSPRASLTAALLAGLVPGADFGTAIMAETLYYPLLTTAFWLVWRWTRAPEAWRGGLSGAVTALAILTKPQGLMLLAVVPLAALAAGWQRREDAGRLALALLAWAGGAALLLSTRVILAAREGFHPPWTLPALLGYYAVQAPAPTLPPDALAPFRHVLLAYGVLLTIAGAGLPLAALLDRGRHPGLVLQVMALASSLLLIAVFARNTVLYNLLGYGHVINEPYLRAEERYLFPVLPLWAVWWAVQADGAYGRWSPRWPLLSAAFVLMGWEALPLLHPFLHFLVTFDAPSLSVPYWMVFHYLGADMLPLRLFFGSVSLLALLGTAWRRPILLGGLMVALSFSWPAVVRQTSNYRNWVTARPLIPWLQRHLPPHALLVIDGNAVSGGVANDVEMFLVHPWRFAFPPHNQLPRLPGGWVLTTADKAVSGSFVHKGFALVPPSAWSRASAGTGANAGS